MYLSTPQCLTMPLTYLHEMQEEQMLFIFGYIPLSRLPFSTLQEHFTSSYMYSALFTSRLLKGEVQ